MNEKLFESKEIHDWHKKLNSKKYSPRFGFRRNASVYPLICYVNNIVGCFLSHHEAPIPVFIGRARTYMVDFPDIAGSPEYYKMVTSYLSAVENHLEEHGVDITSIYNYRNTDGGSKKTYV